MVVWPLNLLDPNSSLLSARLHLQYQVWPKSCTLATNDFFRGGTLTTHQTKNVKWWTDQLPTHDERTLKHIPAKVRQHLWVASKNRKNIVKTFSKHRRRLSLVEICMVHQHLPPIRGYITNGCTHGHGLAVNYTSNLGIPPFFNVSKCLWFCL